MFNSIGGGQQMKLRAWSGRKISFRGLKRVAITGWGLAAILQFFDALVTGDGGEWGMLFVLILFASWLTTVQPDNEALHPSHDPS
jgi:hypothetical protein